MLLGFSLEWTTPETPGYCLDKCAVALQLAGAVVRQRTLDMISFEFLAPHSRDPLGGEISITAGLDETEIQLFIQSDPKDPAVIAFSSKFEARLAELLDTQSPVPLGSKDIERSIFISYRRSDSADIVGRIYDRLISQYGGGTIFKDVDTIPLGTDFRAVIREAVGECRVLLAVVGRGWLSAIDESGSRRLDNPADFVRIELESALERNIPVVPLLVGGASMPKETELPPSLAAFIYRNGIPIRPDPDFHNDMKRLIESLDRALAGR